MSGKIGVSPTFPITYLNANHCSLSVDFYRIGPDSSDSYDQFFYSYLCCLISNNKLLCFQNMQTRDFSDILLSAEHAANHRRGIVLGKPPGREILRNRSLIEALRGAVGDNRTEGLFRLQVLMN